MRHAGLAGKSERRLRSQVEALLKGLGGPRQLLGSLWVWGSTERPMCVCVCAIEGQGAKAGYWVDWVSKASYWRDPWCGWGVCVCVYV